MVMSLSPTSSSSSSAEDEYFLPEDDIFSPFQVICRVFLIPLICLLGIFFNFVNTVVFSQKTMRKQAINFFFLALSLNDILVLVSAVMVFSLPAICEKIDDLDSISRASWLAYEFYPIGQIALTTSVHLTVTVAIHRYRAICHPFSAAKHGKSRRDALVYIASVLIFSISFNIPRWFELKLVERGPENSTFLDIEPTELMVENELFIIIYRNAAYTFIQFLIPFGALSFLNIKIIQAVNSSTKHVRTFATRKFGAASLMAVENNGNSTTVIDGRKCRNQSRDLNKMLVFIMSFFLAFNLVGLIQNLIELFALYHISTKTGNLVTLLAELSTLLIILNASTTNIIYWIFCSKYRTVLRQLFHKITKGLKSNRERTRRNEEATGSRIRPESRSRMDVRITFYRESSRRHSVQYQQTTV